MLYLAKKSEANMPSRYRWYKKNPADWIEGTRDLSPSLRGWYIDILSLIYLYGDDLPADYGLIARELSTSRGRVHEAIHKLCEVGKIRIEDGRIVNDRAREEVGKVFRKRNANDAPSVPQTEQSVPLAEQSVTEAEHDIEQNQPLTDPTRKRKKELEESSTLLGSSSKKKPRTKRPPKGQRKRSRLPDNFAMPEEWITTAIAKAGKNGVEIDVVGEAERFVAHFTVGPGANTLWVDWRRAWLVTWIGKSINFAKGRKSNGSGNRGSRRDGFAAVIEKEMASQPRDARDPPDVGRGRGGRRDQARRLR
jgi:uncharacterized protein YdaU (DUF1376 family)